eukprot:Nitzschia sp. Nitz4//scaffold64_size103689//65388//67067//NITZ4_004440-RA/size103689-processed-gene-0.191-mRNA-1//-1//CDS//3329556142//3832//frame0
MVEPNVELTTTPSTPTQTATVTHSRPKLPPWLIRFIFVLLGIGILIPWNAFVSAKPYFQQRFCRDGELMFSFEVWFGIVWNISSVLSLGILIGSVACLDFVKSMTMTSTRTTTTGVPTSEEGEVVTEEASITSTPHEEHSFGLVMLPLFLYFVVFATMDFLVMLPNLSPTVFAVETLLGLAICGICGAIATAGIVATANRFPSHLGLTPFMAGQSLGGVFVSGASWIAASLEDPQIFWNQTCIDAPELGEAWKNWDLTSNKARITLEDSPTCTPYTQVDTAVLGYFFVGCVVLLACLVGFAWVSQEVPPEEPVHHDEAPTTSQTYQSLLQNSEEQGETVAQETSPLGGNSIPLDAAIPADSPEALLHDMETEENEWIVFRAIRGPLFATFLVFLVTLCLFPAWISQMRSAHECQNENIRLANDLFVPTIFVLFNVGDLAGRLLAEQTPLHRIPHASRALVVGSLARLLFLPLFVFCLTQEAPHHVTVIQSDWYSISVLLAFAVSNGYFVSLSFIQVPTLVLNNAGMQERASEMMTFALYLGLLSGSLLSYPFTQIAFSW